MLKVKLLSAEQLADFKVWVQDKSLIEEGSYYLTFMCEKNIPIPESKEDVKG